MYFFHKTFPGTSPNISHHSELQSPGCLISWLPKISFCGLENWESTSFSQNSALLNFRLYSSQTVYPADTSQATRWHAWHVSGVPDRCLMSLVSLTCIWCPSQVSGVTDTTLLSPTSLMCSWQLSDDPDPSVLFWHNSGVSKMSLLSLTHLWCAWHASSVPNKSECFPGRPVVFWTHLWHMYLLPLHTCGVLNTTIVSLTHMWCSWRICGVLGISVVSLYSL